MRSRATKIRQFVLRKRVIVPLIVLLLAAFYSTFGSTCVCNVCGATQNEVDLQLPFTQVTYWRNTSIKSTPLSETIVRLGLCPPHAHQWHFVYGSGNGVTCAIGDGRHFLGTALRPEVGVFISNVMLYRGKQAAGGWVAQAMDSRRSTRILDILTSYPKVGFTNQQAFDAWWKANEQEIAEIGPDAPPAPPRP